jgi:hypothetical protein
MRQQHGSFHRSGFICRRQDVFAIPFEIASSFSPGEQVSLVVRGRVGIDDTQYGTTVAKECDRNRSASKALFECSCAVVRIDEPEMPFRVAGGLTSPSSSPR